MSKIKLTEEQIFDSVGEKFDVIFDQLPGIDSFTINVGARCPDPHVTEPEFRLKVVGKAGKAISESMRSSLEFLVEKILVGEGLIRKGEFEYSGATHNAMLEINTSVFKKGFRMSPMEEVYEEVYDESDSYAPPVRDKNNKFGR